MSLCHDCVGQRFKELSGVGNGLRESKLLVDLAEQECAAVAGKQPASNVGNNVFTKNLGKLKVFRITVCLALAFRLGKVVLVLFPNST